MSVGGNANTRRYSNANFDSGCNTSAYSDSEYGKREYFLQQHNLDCHMVDKLFRGQH